ncbi:unnamed protein product [Closterium sp. Naga37s-1]|nr:unnamed protein product [Closterium sp. Naga37s-1]
MAACHVRSANASSAATLAEPLASFPLHSSTWCSQAVRGIAHVAPLLHTLSLATSAVSDADVAVCVSSLTRMQVLVLDNCRKLRTDASSRRLPLPHHHFPPPLLQLHTPHLPSLPFSPSPPSTSTDALASDLASSPSLTTISLHRCFGLTPHTISVLLEASRKPGSVLTALVFSHVDRLSVRHVAPPETPQKEPSPREEDDGVMAFLGLAQKKQEEAPHPSHLCTAPAPPTTLTPRPPPQPPSAALSQPLHCPSSLRSLSLHPLFFSSSSSPPSSSPHHPHPHPSTTTASFPAALSQPLHCPSSLRSLSLSPSFFPSSSPLLPLVRPPTPQSHQPPSQQHYLKCSNAPPPSAPSRCTPAKPSLPKRCSCW